MCGLDERFGILMDGKKFPEMAGIGLKRLKID
jgi:hypothetical protein